jgi:hypothetical protein
MRGTLLIHLTISIAEEDGLLVAVVATTMPYVRFLNIYSILKKRIIPLEFAKPKRKILLIHVTH